jgi:hypothetical protein
MFLLAAVLAVFKTWLGVVLLALATAAVARMTTPGWKRWFLSALGALGTFMVLLFGLGSAERHGDEESQATGEAEVEKLEQAAEARRARQREAGSYKILNREVTDTPVKTQVELQVLVNRNATGERLESVLQHVYDEVAAESGFKHHRHPNAIYVWAYTSEDWETNSTGWVGTIQKAAADSKPGIQLMKGLGDMDATGFASRVRETCPVKRCEVDGVGSVLASATVDGSSEFDRYMLWNGVFFSINAMFVRLPDLERLTVEYSHAGDRVARVSVDRAGYNKLGIAGAERALGQAEEALGQRYDLGQVTFDQHEEKVTELQQAHLRRLLAKVVDKEVAAGFGP